MPTFQVKYALRAVIGIEIKAKDFAEARAKADNAMQKELFVEGIASIDENFMYIGIDDLDGWNTDFE